MSTAPLQILNFAPGTAYISSSFTAVNDLTYVAVEESDDLYPDEGVRDRHLWVLDGTVEGTRAINHTGALIGTVGSIGNQVYFFTYQQGTGATPGGAYLWVTDGTDAGTRRLSGPNPGTYQELEFSLETQRPTVFDGKLVFSFGTDGAFEPWISDGTQTGTRVLDDLQPNTSPEKGSDSNNFVVLGGRLLFSAYTDATGREFWISDGTPEGTQLLMDIAEGDVSSYPSLLGQVGNRLIFKAYDETVGRELWVTDGTAAGTHLLKDIRSGPESVSEIYRGTYTADGSMVFFAGDQDGNMDLWITNGTTAGTQKLYDTDFYEVGVGAIAAGDKVFFAGTSFLGVTDGTVAGTRRLADIDFELVDRPPNYNTVVPAILDGKAIFRSSTNAAGGSELWISDGTAAGTQLLKDLNASGSSRPFDFYMANGRVLFNANYNELWVTDGTAAGTRRLMAGVSDDDFFEANEGGNAYYETVPSGFTSLAGKTYFQGYDLSHGFELWVTDGTAAGTSLVADLNPGSAGSYPRGLAVVNGQLMFIAGNGVWAIDPSSETPTLSGAGGRRSFTVRTGDGTVEIANFGGYGTGSLSTTEKAELDTLRLIGSGLDPRRMLLQQQGADLVLAFEGVANTRIVLQDFALENLENFPSGLGNIIFNGQRQVRDSFDVFDANSSRQTLWRRDTTTFLNDRANWVRGFNNSDDAINGQDGADWIDGRSGKDTLRGGKGNDALVGGRENDRLVGNDGADAFRFTANQSFSQARLGVDTIADFTGDEGDRIVLDKTVFRKLQSGVGEGLRSSEFARVSEDAAVTRSGALIVYNTSNGRLFYNENGSQSGFGSGGQFAVLTGSPDLSRNGFTVQA
ncbi:MULTISPECIES: ELWxxDGT repeat protein [unclassified Leptolyngbya]|uniref:ELWxxDGT repeat protein n=1 Tax=unclassified Leptolyngbya TaxID=2650499 RepID=UPI001681D786|nr:MULTISPECIES: ELWxxDGT repeat protein [unclassified Leptolyngbya]MBD1911654.1 hypothetical protein [Leptolyngbya sp. FACHB-8]MBD2154607.1 hypothetical protein [Leptolyngbya sp. FACHB-16]